MIRTLGIKTNPDYIAQGTYVAYIYNKKLHVGITKSGLNAGKGKFTVINCETNETEYPYTQDILITNKEVSEVIPTIKLE